MDIVGNRDVSAQPVEKIQFQPYGNSGASSANGEKPIEDGAVTTSIGRQDGQANNMQESLDPTKEETQQMTKAMNDMMEKMNCNIKFSIHERTKRLMVQVISQKDGKVLKEFPPKEMLDVLANISDSIGMILDKKA